MMNDKLQPHWLLGLVGFPFIMLWCYLVGLYYQYGYLSFFSIQTTFAELDFNYLIIGWIPVIGFAVGFLATCILIIELIHRILGPEVFNFFIKYLVLGFITLYLPSVFTDGGYKAFSLLCVNAFLFTAFAVHDLIMMLKFKKFIFEKSVFHKISKKFGFGIIALLVAFSSIIFSQQKGFDDARRQITFPVLKQDSSEAIIYIGKKYFFTMPIIDQEKGILGREITITNLDEMSSSIVYKRIGTGLLIVQDVLLKN